MDFGDPASLRTLSSQLSGQAAQTDSVHGNISRAASGLVGSVSQYERASAAAFASRWADVGGVIKRLASDSGEIARALTTLADALDQASSDWNSAENEAWGAGFTVWPSEWSASVTAPAGAKDDAVQHAARLEQAMRDAASDAESARATLSRVLEGAADRGLAELSGGNAALSAYASTGDAGLDSELARVVGPMLAAHDTITSRS